MRKAQRSRLDNDIIGKPVDCFWFPTISQQIREAIRGSSSSQTDLCHCHLMPQDPAAYISVIEALVKAPGCHQRLVETAERLGVDGCDLESALDCDQPPLLNFCREICGSPSLKAQVLELPFEISHAFQTQVRNLQHHAATTLDAKLANALGQLLVKIAEASPFNIPPHVLIRGVELNHLNVRLSGHFADEHQGMYNGRLVAVKQCLPSLQSDDHYLILREAATWMTLQHRYILPMIGVQHLGHAAAGGVWIVSPWMHNGTMREFRAIQGRRSIRKFCNQITEAVGYLHSKGIVHGDLRASNILLDSEENIKIFNFSLSVFHNAPRGEATEVYGADRWMAPELFTDISEFKRTKESDVYAFACTLLELYTGEIPWRDMRTHAVAGAVKSSHRPNIPPWPSEPGKGVPPAIATIIQQCWADNPRERLTMDEVQAALIKL